jgi:hypothetical protein
VKQDGYPVADDVVTFTADDPDVKIAAVTSRPDGTYTATITASTTAHNVAITATDSSLAPAGVAQATLTQTVGPASALTVALSPARLVADGRALSTATATLEDALGRAVVGDTVAFTTNDPEVKIGAVSANPDGTYTATITASTTPHDVTIAATDSSVTPGVAGQATLTQTIGTAGTVTVSLSPNRVVADGKALSTATATVKDALGRAVTGDTVTFTANDPGVKIGAVTGHPDGTHTVGITASTTPHDVTITATDATVTPAISGRATLTLTPASTIDTKNPVVAIGAGPLTVANSSVKVSLTCPTGQSYCEGKVILSATGKGLTHVLGDKPMKILGGRTQTVPIALSKTVLSLLAPATSVQAKVSVTARNAAGRTGSSSRSLKLILPVDRTNPRVAILRYRLATRPVRALVNLACPANQSVCSGATTIRVKQHGRDVVAGRSNFRIAGDRSKTVEVTILKRFRPQFQRAASIRAVIRVEARNSAGRKGISQRAVTLRPSGARH